MSEEETADLHGSLIEQLRDMWPSQKGLAALLFQNDLFRRLRRIEEIAEGNDGEAHGFLPDDWPDFKGDEAYESIWAAIDAACGPDTWAFVDATEDVVVQWCTDMIPEKISFFAAALETGALDEDWLEKAELLREIEAPRTTVSEPPPAKPDPVITLEPERQPARPTRRHASRPFTPTKLRPRVRSTRKHK